MSSNRVFAQKTIIVGLGGLSGSVMVAAKTSIAVRIGQADASWVRYLHIDYANSADPTPKDLITRYGEQRIQGLTNAETLELSVDPVRDIARNSSSDPRFAPMFALCPSTLLLTTTSAQAGGIPSCGRAAMWLKLDVFVRRFEQILRELAPAGTVDRGLLRSGYGSDQVSKEVRVALVHGAEGGTGAGSMLLVALLAAAVGRQMGIPVVMEAWPCFRYRETTDQEANLRMALGQQLALDLEAVQQPGKVLETTSYSGCTYSAITPLFRRIISTEGFGQLHGNAPGLAVLNGEALAFRCTTRAANSLELGFGQNILSRTR